MTKRFELSIDYLAEDIFPMFLNSIGGHDALTKLYSLEKDGRESPYVCTVAKGVDLSTEGAWLQLFTVLSEHISIGMVVSDMTVPGIPLAYINEGFKTETGYGKEKIGTSCRFLQGPETESYVNDEIMETLQQGERGLFKLHNYKASGEKFQCLFALHPVFGHASDPVYKYQVGIQVDNNQPQFLLQRISEMSRLLRYLPQTIDGSHPHGVTEKISAIYGHLSTGSSNLKNGQDLGTTIKTSLKSAPFSTQGFEEAKSFSNGFGDESKSPGTTIGLRPKQPHESPPSFHSPLYGRGQM